MSGSHEAMSEKALVSFSYVNVASRVMSEGVGACILSWGELCCTVRDVSNLDYFLGQIRADIHSNCLTNGPNAFSFPQSSQVLKEVLLPFFEKKYSEHLLFCTWRRGWLVHPGRPAVFKIIPVQRGLSPCFDTLWWNWSVSSECLQIVKTIKNQLAIN